ncbi:MAG: hypothetical protein RI996_595 [Candidatus Parcubacteria bacterium]
MIVIAWIWEYYQIQKRPKVISSDMNLITVADIAPSIVATTTREIYETAFAHKTDMFKTVSVISGDLLPVRTKVQGEVRGNWYFEATFPAELRVGTSTVIWSGVAQAQGSWMTTDFVPFTMNISYTALGTTTPATLILKKDNPSGDPINDDELQIAVLVQ